MDFPDNLQDLINNNKGQGESIMQIRMIDSDDDFNGNLLSWSFESFDS